MTPRDVQLLAKVEGAVVSRGQLLKFLADFRQGRAFVRQSLLHEFDGIGYARHGITIGEYNIKATISIYVCCLYDSICLDFGFLTICAGDASSPPKGKLLGSVCPCPNCLPLLPCVSFASESSACDPRFRLGWTARKLTLTCGSIRRVFPSISPASWTETGAGPGTGTCRASPGTAPVSPRCVRRSKPRRASEFRPWRSPPSPRQT